MNFFITIMFMFVFHIYACNKWKVFSNRKVFKIIIISFFMVMFLFSALAILTSREGISKIENIIKYIGSPIVGLNYYLNSSHIPNIIWGQETLYYFYQLLREWGADIPWYKWHHEFYSYGINSTSNLYTGLRRAIQDFGVLGMFLTRFVLGIFYMKLFTKIRRFNSSDYNNIPIIIFCCMLCVPLAMMSITDAIPEYISTSTFYTLFYLYFIKVSGMFKLQAEVK